VVIWWKLERAEGEKTGGEDIVYLYGVMQVYCSTILYSMDSLVLACFMHLFLILRIHIYKIVDP
jgi:hypothetical protein